MSGPQRYPINGTFELTVRCNMKCKMCLFRHADEENEILQKNELTAGQWIDMARQAAQAGCVSLLITGGEPMLRPDFCEIWEGIYKLGFITELYTNGTLITPKIMDTLRKYPPHKIGVTIYGASPDTYERVCGNGKMFQRAMEGFEQLITLPSRIEFRTTIIKDNYDDFTELHNLVKTRFNCNNLIHAALVNQSVRGACADASACRLEPEDNAYLSIKRSMDLIQEYMGEQYDEKCVHFEIKEVADICGDDSGYSTSKAGRYTIFGCDAGMRQFTITWDGRLQGCQMLGAFFTSPLELGFQKAWEMYPYQVRLPEENPDCRECDNKKYCNCCPASRLAETGSLNGCSDYVCQEVAATVKLVRRYSHTS